LKVTDFVVCPGAGKFGVDFGGPKLLSASGQGDKDMAQAAENLGLDTP